MSRQLKYTRPRSIDLTEFGWPTSPSGTVPAGTASQAWVNEGSRAGYMERMTSEYVRSDCNTEGLPELPPQALPEALQGLQAGPGAATAEACHAKLRPLATFAANGGPSRLKLPPGVSMSFLWARAPAPARERSQSKDGMTGRERTQVERREP
jgi:hypothetical protein